MQKIPAVVTSITGIHTEATHRSHDADTEELAEFQARETSPTPSDQMSRKTHQTKSSKKLITSLKYKYSQGKTTKGNSQILHITKLMYNPNLIWIPNRGGQVGQPANESDQSQKSGEIPCLFLPYSQPSNRLIIYFHGNSEDIGDTELLFFPLRQIWKCHILSVEYPSYGQYTKHAPLSEESIYSDAETIYQHLVAKFKVKESQIVLLGRSLGTAPAVHLASVFNPAGIILVSPFCSIREVAGAIAFKFLASFVKERFDNQTKIQTVTAPLLVIHGLKDELVPVKQGQTLIDLAGSPKKRLITPPDMTHTLSDLLEDLGIPISKFLSELSGSGQEGLAESGVFPLEEAIDWECFFGASRLATLESTLTETNVQPQILRSPVLDTEETEMGSPEPENFATSQIDERGH